MICGREYSTENPFNKEAADYYAKHSNVLPLDTLDNPSKKEKSKEKEPISLEFLGPLLKIGTGLLIVLTVAGRGIYFFEN